MPNQSTQRRDVVEGNDRKSRLGQLKKKYWGTVATTYEDGRTNSRHWRREQKIVSRLLQQAEVGEDSRVLDVPVGTGRFFPLYKGLGCQAVGVDASPDMISQAQRKADGVGLDAVDLRIGDITDLQINDGSADVAVCIRLMNWLDFPLFQKALSELRRVSSRHVIVGIRLSTGKTHFGNRVWLEETLKAGKQGLRSVKHWVLESLREKNRESTSRQDFSGPSLVDHPEEVVRREFRRQGLTVDEEEQVLMFTSTPRLLRLGTIEELPYRIFLLRV